MISFGNILKIIIGMYFMSKETFRSKAGLSKANLLRLEIINSIIAEYSKHEGDD